MVVSTNDLCFLLSKSYRYILNSKLALRLFPSTYAGTFILCPMIYNSEITFVFQNNIKLKIFENNFLIIFFSVNFNSQNSEGKMKFLQFLFFVEKKNSVHLPRLEVSIFCYFSSVPLNFLKMKLKYLNFNKFKMF